MERKHEPSAKGKMYAGQSVAALAAMHLTPDFNFTETSNSTRLEFVHRKLSDADIYFVDNRSDKSVTAEATFRVAGKEAAFWYAETGRSKPASFKIAQGATTVPLSIEPTGTVFVVFSKTTSEISRKLPDQRQSQLLAVEGPWNVAFQPDRGAPASLTLEKLISWPDSEDKGVKYFSGNSDIHEVCRCKTRVVRQGQATLARSRRSSKSGPDRGEWKAAWSRLAYAL